MALQVYYCASKLPLFLSGVVLINLLTGCKQNPPVHDRNENNQNPGFSFYPTKDALWMEKSSLSTPKGTVYYYDTFYLGKDTLMETKTMEPESSYHSDADSATLKRY